MSPIDRLVTATLGTTTFKIALRISGKGAAFAVIDVLVLVSMGDRGRIGDRPRTRDPA